MTQSLTPTLPAPARPASPVRRRYRFGRTTRKVVLTTHILTAAGWFGIAVLIAAAVVSAGATRDLTLKTVLYRAVVDAIWISVPMGVTALVTGVLLGIGTVWGVFQHWWVVAKLAINVAVTVTDLVLVRPVAAHALATGIASRPIYGATIAHCVVLTIATTLSVFKPWGRTRWGSRR